MRDEVWERVDREVQQLSDLMAQAFADATGVATAAPEAGFSRRNAVANEVAKLRRKLDRAEQLLTRLESIPERDPWGDGIALRVKWHGYDYLLLRAEGKWYSTGRQLGAPYKFSWAQLVEWLLKGDVQSVLELRPDRWVSLSSPTLSPDAGPGWWCGALRVHDPHTFLQGHPPTKLGCGGTIRRQCLDDRTHESHIEGDEEHRRFLCDGR